MRLPILFTFPVLVLLAGLTSAQQKQHAWVERSNQNAQLLLSVDARYSPEGAGAQGMSGLDEQISIPAVDAQARRRNDMEAALEVLRSRLASEQDPLVKQDLEILIQAAERDVRRSLMAEKFLLPYGNVGSAVFFGIKSLLDDQVAPERRKAAVVRLRRYTGLEEGYSPATLLAENVFRERVKKGPNLLGPPREQVQQDIQNMDSYVTGIGLLLEKYKMTGYRDAYAKLREQLAQYTDFLKTEVLEKARTDFRLPAEVYASNLEAVGVDYTPAELKRLAHESFTEIQAEMTTLAAKIAHEQHLPSSDYRAVLRELKKNQLQPDQVMPLYHERLAQIEDIIRKEHLVTLPDRPCIIRLASAAETAQQPAPHMQPPVLINNHGEQGAFVLPSGTKGADGQPLKYDDFTFSAAAWTLTAHEARPGHELQFAAMVERGVSQARAIFAFNSTNVEGWGLYSEWLMLPYMPDDAKLVSLQFRLVRAARAFLDPELQEGKLTPAQAHAVLEDDVVLSKALATEEVDRYTFRSPGQAVSYFDGYLRLRELRKDVEQILGNKFNAQRFHDFVLAQGLLPQNLMRKAVMTDFVGQEK